MFSQLGEEKERRERQTKILTDRQTDRQPERQTDRQTVGRTSIQIDKKRKRGRDTNGDGQKRKIDK